eukprot:scaffold151438_cov26-Tisochrysis_lutea.AAC.2
MVKFPAAQGQEQGRDGRCRIQGRLDLPRFKIRLSSTAQGDHDREACRFTSSNCPVTVVYALLRAQDNLHYQIGGALIFTSSSVIGGHRAHP